MSLGRSRDRLGILRIPIRPLLAKKRFYRLLGVLAGIWIVWTFLLSDSSVVRYVMHRSENGRLRAEIARTEGKLDSLRTLAAELRTDPDAVERIARDRYHYLAEGEKAYVFLAVDESEKERARANPEAFLTPQNHPHWPERQVDPAPAGRLFRNAVNHARSVARR